MTEWPEPRSSEGARASRTWSPELAPYLMMFDFCVWSSEGSAQLLEVRDGLIMTGSGVHRNMGTGKGMGRKCRRELRRKRRGEYPLTPLRIP